ncbi:MAG TPA: nucleotidyltransferase family protein, partial [Gemmatimonadaceae bacterium]|nr:nucleotidyltransferase family protein [Gemmatimonadaceae bacterium]
MDEFNRDAAASEATVLLAAASVHPAADVVRRANAALSPEGGIDWQTFVPLASEHGVAPLLHHHLSSGVLDSSNLPESAVAEVRRVADGIARRSLLLTGELVALLNAFESEGIRVVSLKGPILAEQIYGSVALRRFNDLDLLVAPEDVERAIALLTSRGYTLDDSKISDDLEAIRRGVESYHRSLLSPAKTHRVELHHFLFAPLGHRTTTIAAIETGLVRRPFHATSVWMLQAEDLLAYLCVHGTKHAWQRIEWVGAVAELVRSGRVADWDRVDAVARAFGAEGAVAAGLHLVRDLFDAPVPELELTKRDSVRAAARSFNSNSGTGASNKSRTRW